MTQIMETSINIKKEKYLNFLFFSKIDNWDIRGVFSEEIKFSKKYPIVKGNYFLNKVSTQKIKIENGREYKILGVRSYGVGAFINRVVNGSTLKMRTYQKAFENALFWCKVDTKNGAFGTITGELSEGIGSSNMTFASIDTTKAFLPYIELLFKIKSFNQYMDSYVTGTTNRKYLSQDQILNDIQFPLPNIDTQKKIVSEYYSKIDEAKRLDNLAVEKEKEIENYLMDTLGITITNTEKKAGLNFVRFSELERWDVSEFGVGIFSDLQKAKYKLGKLGDTYDFISRPWKKENNKSKYFKYIEIGGVDESKGILGATELEVKKAPSRASQIVISGDLIVATTRPYLKKFAIVDETYSNNICSSGFQIISESSQYSVKFLLEFLRSQAGIKQFEYYMTGALYPAITSRDFKKMQIPLPPLDIQKAIVIYIEKLKNAILSSKIKSEELKQKAKEDFEKELFS